MIANHLAGWEQIAMFEIVDCCHKSPDSGDLQYKTCVTNTLSGTTESRFSHTQCASVPCLDPRREGLAPVGVVPATGDDGHVYLGGSPSRRGVLPPERDRVEVVILSEIHGLR